MTDRYDDDTTAGRGDYQTANFAFMTLEEEQQAGGWTRINMPVGPGGPPDAAPTVGMRGESDIDDDPSYGPKGVNGAPPFDGPGGNGPQAPPTYGGGR